MGNPQRQNILMVGDTLESDILGGINAGLDTCWFNLNNSETSGDIVPKHQVSKLAELEDLLLGTGDMPILQGQLPIAEKEDEAIYSIS